MRNPQRTYSESGDWAANSENWTQRALSEMDMEQSDDTVFAVSLEDFLQNFRCTIINHTSGSDENIPVKKCQTEIDFAANEDSERSF